MGEPYRERSLDRRLGEMVVCAWSSRIDGGDDGSHPVMPDGCIDLLFESATGHLEVVGTMTKTLWVSGCGPTEYLGVRFRRGGAAPLLHIHVAELLGPTLDHSSSIDASMKIRARTRRSKRLRQRFVARRDARSGRRITHGRAAVTFSQLARAPRPAAGLRGWGSGAVFGLRSPAAPPHPKWVWISLQRSWRGASLLNAREIIR